MESMDDEDLRDFRRYRALSRTRRVVGLLIGFLVIAPLLFVLCGGVTTWLWNALMPTIFHLPTIGFWQAVGLLLLSWLLFGGWRGYPRPRPWRRHMRERWEAMTPEQRAAFRRAMRERWGERWGRCETRHAGTGTAGSVSDAGAGGGGPTT
jgi:hypothetical protein